MLGKLTKSIHSAKMLLSVICRGLLAGISALTVAQTDVGPAGSGLTARASDASSAFWSPAAITRLDQPELVTGATLVVLTS
jgi:long-subunit fatty acid transport protein